MATKCEGSPSLPAGESPSSSSRGGSESGFTLVEVMFAAIILVVGLLSLAQLLAVTIRAESLARNGAEATRLAQGQLDSLMKASLDADPRVQITPTGTDSLAANVNNYFRLYTNPVPTRPSSIVRWQVTAGPASTRVITVRVLIANGTTTMRIIDLTSLLRRW
jgi:type II secretory pathway pseudopilin PulG